MCSVMNPLENTVCKECGARLVPQTGPLTEAEGPRPEPVEGLRPEPVEGLRPEPVEGPRPEPVEGPPSPIEGPSAEQEAETPDWLQRLRASSAEEVPAGERPAMPEVSPAEPAEEIPDWLKAMRPSEETKPRVPPMAWEDEAEMRDDTSSIGMAPYPSGEEEPDWLKRLRAASTGKPAPAEEPAIPPGPPPRPMEVPPAGEVAVPPQEEELGPDWLERLRQIIPEETPPAETAEAAPPVFEEAAAPPSSAEIEPEEEIPDWLQRLRPEPEEPPYVPLEAEAPSLAEEEAAEVPDWLRELRPEPEAPPTAVEAEEGEEQAIALERFEEEIAEEMPPPIEQVPDWLKEPETVPPEGEVPVFEEAEGVPPAEEAPEWLRELGPAEEAVEAPPSVLGVEMPTDEAPDWLKELGPPVTAERPAIEEEAPLPPPTPMKEEVSPPVAAEEALEVEGLAQAEIPAWLQELRPREVEEGVAEVPGVVEAVETTGLLAGIQGVLPSEPIVSWPHKAPPAPTAAVTVGPEQANLFREIIAQEPVPVTEVIAPRRVRIWGEVLRWLIYLLIALAVIIPLFGGGDWFGEAELPSGAATDFYNAIQNLPSNSAVLLAFDYDPSTAAEMDRLAEPVLWHLMDRGVKLMAVSLLPTGPTVAGNLLDRVAGEHDGGYQYGQKYVNLGYIPGQAAAPNELASDLRALVPQDYRQGKSLAELPVMQEVNGIQDVSLIIEFAAQQRTLQWWIEQVGSQYQVQIMAAVSAAVEPTATPYHNSDQLVGLISGLTSAAQYEMKTNKWPSLAIASVDAQSVAHLAIVALIVLGSLASLVSARRK
jgi:hypothetical protein